MSAPLPAAVQRNLFVTDRPMTMGVVEPYRVSAGWLPTPPWASGQFGTAAVLVRHGVRSRILGRSRMDMMSDRSQVNLFPDAVTGRYRHALGQMSHQCHAAVSRHTMAEELVGAYEAVLQYEAGIRCTTVDRSLPLQTSKGLICHSLQDNFDSRPQSAGYSNGNK